MSRRKKALTLHSIKNLTIQSPYDRETLINRITTRIRHSLELQEILTTTVREIRSFLAVDRVKIYKFAPDGSGQVIAESIYQNSLPSMLGLHFPSTDIPNHSKELFIKARQRVIVDVARGVQTLNLLDSPETGEPLFKEDIRYAPVDPCHAEYLSNMGVTSSLALPILHQKNLWGLLVAHHSQSRRFSERELTIVQLLVDQVSIAIAQSNLLSQARQQAHHETVINQISRLLHSPLNVTDIRQNVLEKTVKALEGSGGRLYITNDSTGQPAQLYTCGQQPEQAWIENTRIWHNLLNLPTDMPVETHLDLSFLNTELEVNYKSLHPQVFEKLNSSEIESDSPQIIPLIYTIRNLYEDSKLSALREAFQYTKICSLLIIPLQYHQQYVGCLTIFRNEIETERLWAGRLNPDTRTFGPRKSFEAWREIKKGQAKSWTPEEIKLAQSVGIHLYMAVMQRRVEDTIRHQASHDLLTGLPNRMLFNDRLSLALANLLRHGGMVAVMFLDLDHFKTINDTLGHAVGDQLLKEVAERLKDCLRAGDTVARLGGDEFTLLLPQISTTEEVAQMAQQILKTLNIPFLLSDHELYVKASLGIALAPFDGEDVETLVKNADAAMYRAKQQGRNNYQIYKPAMGTKVLERLVLETNLYKALERKEFLLHYQPQICLKTGTIIGMEALIRWHQPDIGLISPNQFIPIAEEIGLIDEIGNWVLQTACAQNQAWQALGLPPMRMSVNLSARQFQQKNLVKTITQVLQETQLNPQYLEIEITESIAMQDIKFTISVLKLLQNEGVHISIDDFGTGYSSLSSLKHFPLNTLKIDQYFIHDLTTDKNAAAIIKAVIALGHGLNLTVIAEGVETQDQLDFLRSLDCDAMQGYLFSRPVCAEDATQLCLAGKKLMH